MTEGAWLFLAAILPSTAIAFAGYRATRVAHFKDRIDMLEKQTKECKQEVEEWKDQVRRLREDNEWLMRQSQRRDGVRRPKIDG